MQFFFRDIPDKILQINKQNKIIKKIDNEINKIIKNSIFVKLSNINSKHLFQYLSILFLSVSFLNYIDIGFKAVIGIILGLTICYIIYDKRLLDVNSYNEQLFLKLQLIKPYPKYFKNYPELIEFFYSIRDFYDYNYQAFTNCIKHMELFLIIYQDIKSGVINCSQNIDIIRNKKKNILNHLHSIIFNMPDNKIIEKKLKKAMTELNKILNMYENDMINICNKQINDNGYSNDKSYVYSGGPKAYNLFTGSKEIEHFNIY